MFFLLTAYLWFVLLYYICIVYMCCFVCILFGLLRLSNKNAHEEDCETLSLGRPVNMFAPVGLLHRTPWKAETV